MLRGIWGDDERYQQQYWTKVPGNYLTGDNARQDDDGYYWIMGRIDDVINVSGHRLSTIEVESRPWSAIRSWPKPPPSAGPTNSRARPSPSSSRSKAARPTTPSRTSCKQHVRKEIGALAVPDDIRFTATLPKTRSGKIMRRLLRDIAAGKELVGDTSTLEDYAALAKLREEEE